MDRPNEYVAAERAAEDKRKYESHEEIWMRYELKKKKKNSNTTTTNRTEEAASAAAAAGWKWFSCHILNRLRIAVLAVPALRAKNGIVRAVF